MDLLSCTRLLRAKTGATPSCPRTSHSSSTPSLAVLRATCSSSPCPTSSPFAPEWESLIPKLTQPWRPSLASPRCSFLLCVVPNTYAALSLTRFRCHRHPEELAATMEPSSCPVAADGPPPPLRVAGKPPPTGSARSRRLRHIPGLPVAPRPTSYSCHGRR